jgi:hypothetical protein
LTLVSPVPINNTGTIELDSTGGKTFLYFDQPFPVLSGGGNIRLDGGAGAQDIIAGTPGQGFAVSLDNQNNVISGAGEIGHSITFAGVTVAHLQQAAQSGRVILH